MPTPNFQTVRSEGGLLPPDLLRRIADAPNRLPGTSPGDYNLTPGDRLNEIITQSWNRLRRHWTDFRTAARSLPDGEPAAKLTSDRWTLPLLRELGFGIVPTSASPVIGERTWPINRFFATTAIHLIGCGLSLDRRSTGPRTPGTNPHGLVQEFLNRSPDHLWAILTNGLRFRILRDNQALSRQSFLEFDLEAMFTGEVFSDFVLLWLTAHATRFTPQTENRAESCWLEQWTKTAAQDGTRALEKLQAGVEKALQILGEAFVSHPRNTALRESLRSGELPLNTLHEQLLRVVYRLLFLFVAEDRTLDGNSLLHPIDTSDTAAIARERYARHYSTSRLRTLASTIKGSRHGDLWQQFNLIVAALHGSDEFAAVREQLALAPLGSLLWNPQKTSFLNSRLLGGEHAMELSNADFLDAIRNLAFTTEGKLLRPVDYKNLGAEELGGVYTSLLALTPQINADGTRFTFAEFAGNARKTSGSYYTPDCLVQCLLDSALDPVVQERLEWAERAAKAEWKWVEGEWRIANGESGGGGGEWRIANGEWGSGVGSGKKVVDGNVSDGKQQSCERVGLIHEFELRLNEYVRERLSGSGSLAAGDGDSGVGVPADAWVSAGGAIRDDSSDVASINVDPGQSGRGLGTGRSPRISAVHSDRPGQPEGTGNPTPAQRTSATGNPNSNSPDSATNSNPRPSTNRPAPLPPPLQTNPTRIESPPSPHSPSPTFALPPFAIRHSLFANHAILGIKVCDPSVGSGHFLVGAAHRLARHLARVRAWGQGDSEPSPLLYQQALRDVISRCLYGVDINPMAVELCRINLWLEALEPGKPLSFLDHHIQVGNSLLGTTPALLEAGIPDDAFTAIEGDVKTRVTALKKQNKKEREEYKKGQGYLFDVPIKLGNLAAALAKIDQAPDDTAAAIQQKEQHYAELVNSTEYQYGRLLADLWCAAFVWKKDDSDLGKLCPTERDFRKVESHAASGLLPHVRKEVERLRDQYQFFHWHIAFPDVFGVGGSKERGSEEGGNSEQASTPRNASLSSSLANSLIPSLANSGFDVMLGNPPWERVKLQEQEFFAQREPTIAGAANAAARKKEIAALKDTNPRLLEEFAEASRQAEGESHLMRSSGRFALCGRGDINTYAIFAEVMRDTLSQSGRMGVIVPTGIATDDTTKFFFGDLVATRTLVSYFGFKNERFLFPRPVEHTVTFGLLTVLGRGSFSENMQFCWLAWTVSEMKDHARRIVLTSDDIERLNPNTRTCPVFRTERDAEITKGIYRRVPVLIREARDGQTESNPWGISFLRMFDMANSSGLFVAPETACPAVQASLDAGPESPPPYLPLYEAKMLHQFDHRWATYSREGASSLDTPILTKVNRDGKRDPDTRDLSPEEKDRPDMCAAPRYWVSATEVDARLMKTDSDGSVTWRWDRDWLLGWRDIARSTDDRTCIASVVPRVPAGDTLLLMFPNLLDEKHAACLIACLDSFVVDYAARQKVGGTHLKYHTFKQFPVLPPSTFRDPCPWDDLTTLAGWIAPRVLELVYTAHDLSGFASDLRYQGPPFHWDVGRRAQIRAELDATFFHLYGVRRDDAAYILDTFVVFKARDEHRYAGDYRTKRVILEIYDAIQTATRTGQPYQTLLNPPPGPPTDANGNFLPPNQWPPDSWPSHIHPPRGEV